MHQYFCSYHILPFSFFLPISNFVFGFISFHFIHFLIYPILRMCCLIKVTVLYNLSHVWIFFRNISSQLRFRINVFFFLQHLHVPTQVCMPHTHTLIHVCISSSPPPPQHNQGNQVMLFLCKQQIHFTVEHANTKKGNTHTHFF